MLPVSPRDEGLRLPRTTPPTSARHRHEQQQYHHHQQQLYRDDSHRQLQLLDLAFQGHASPHTSAAAAFEYEQQLDELHRSRPSSARSARSSRSSHSSRSVRSSRSREYAYDSVDSGYHRHHHQHIPQQQQQHIHQHYEEHNHRQHHFTTAPTDYAAAAAAAYAHGDDNAHAPIQALASVAQHDESALMEASDPELFHAGVEEHARRLGIDPEVDSDFLWLARESLVAPLPDGWYHVTATETGAPYYYNELTGESRWDHPCDDQFRAIYSELKLKQQQQQQQQQLHSSRRYDHYSPPSATAASAVGDSSDNASYYAVAGSTTQTIAWQTEASGDLQSSDTTVDYNTTRGYDDVDYTSNYAAAHEQQQTAATDWNASSADDTQHDAYSDYTYPAPSDACEHEASNYDTESVPVTTVTSTSSARRRSVATDDADSAPASQQQQAMRSLEAQRLQDEQLICDLRIQLQSLTKDLETQRDALATLTTDKRDVEAKLRDVRTQFDASVQSSDDLTERNQTMKRELLAARTQLETQQSDAATRGDSNDGVRECERLTTALTNEQARCEAAENARDDALRLQSRLTKQLEDARAQTLELRDALAALEALGKQTDARASASAADASVTAAAVAALTQQLSDKDAALAAAHATTQTLQQEIADLLDERAHAHATLDATASQQATQSQTLATTTAALERSTADAAALRIELQRTLTTTQRLETQAAEQQTRSAAQLSEAEEQHRALKRESRALERDLKTLQTTSKARDDELRAATIHIDALETRLREQAALVETARLAGFAEAERASAELVRQAQAEKSRMAELYAQELQARRKLHNRLMELQGNIRVFCRVRPIQPVEMKSDHAAQAIFFREHDHESLELVVGATEVGSSNSNDKSSGGSAGLLGQKHAFEFDHIFQPSSTQAEVFEQTRALVVSALDGFNVCIFAYGQTGSGKTHTMEGTTADRGVNFRALQELFRIRDDRVAAGGFACSMKLSILEVYNETIVDLLDNSTSTNNSHSTGASTKGLDVRMGKTGVYVDNLIEVEVLSERDVIDLMQLGHSHRSVGSHDVNEHSSRSHLVLSIQIEMTTTTPMTPQRSSVDAASKTGQRRVSKLHLIDLAGSERVSKTAASGQRLKEAQNINRSLSALGDVIAALSASSKHVPYRNSKLTFLLQDALGGNSKVLMFVNVSPVQWNAWETLCSLNFASRCRSVALGPAKQTTNASGASTSQASVNGGAVSPLPPSVSGSSSSNVAAVRSALRAGGSSGPSSVPKSSQRS